MSGDSRRPKRQKVAHNDYTDVLRRRGIALIQRLEQKDEYGIFLEPVPDDIPGYKDVIDHPMDFSTVRKNLKAGRYEKLEQLCADINLIWNNCLKFNPAESIYAKQALKLRDIARPLLIDLAKALPSAATRVPKASPPKKVAGKSSLAQKAETKQTKQAKPTRPRKVVNPTRPSETPAVSTAPPSPKSSSIPTGKRPRDEKNIFLGPIIECSTKLDRPRHLPPSILERLEIPPEPWRPETSAGPPPRQRGHCAPAARA